MNRYIFFTNIPAPYRVAFYNALHLTGLCFEVLYMRTTTDERQWLFDPSQMRHTYLINDGYYRMVGRFHLHLNPRIVYRIFRAGAVDVIIGANWNDIDVIVLAALKRLGLLRARLHFWSEANYLTLGASRDNWFKRALRRFVYNASSGLQISSGRMTEITFDKWGLRGKRFIPLPNTIEEERFVITEADLAKREEHQQPIFVMPVRLLENVKGVINFFRAIGPENVRRAQFWVAGDGPDRARVEAFVREHRLEDSVRLLGFCGPDTMVRLYAQANALILPSFSDPSPLSAIEALRMQLPLLLSERCGNHFEALVSGENGYLFDPLRASSVKEAFEVFLERRSAWAEMGRWSGQRYAAMFDKSMVIERFARALTEATRDGAVASPRQAQC